MGITYCKATPAETLTPAKFVSDRDFMHLWGYGESLGASNNFCGTDPAGNCDSDDGVRASSPLEILQYAGPTEGGDADSDTLPNKSDNCPANAAAAGTINCDPLSGTCLVTYNDKDGDGAADECDPSPNWFDRWVGPGDAASNRGAYNPFKPLAPIWKEAGWLDTDDDGSINGSDVCPADGSSLGIAASNVNAWGENADFGYGLTDPLLGYFDDIHGDGTYSPTRAHTGFVTRGDACDPYETTYLAHADSWVTQGAGGGPCDPGPRTVGIDSIPIKLQPNRGISSNDLLPNHDPEAVQVDLRRCACTGVSDCFDPNIGECAKAIPLKNAQQQAPGRGWLPVERSSCAQQWTGPLTGFCDVYGTFAPLPGGPGAMREVLWDWLSEYMTDANNTRFPQEWFVQEALLSGDTYLRATVSFSLASETIYDMPDGVTPEVWTPNSRRVGQEADITPKYDPTNMLGPPYGAVLPDWKERTRRLRTFFDDHQLAPQQQHQEQGFASPWCNWHLTYDPNWWKEAWPGPIPPDDGWSLPDKGPFPPPFPPFDRLTREDWWQLVEDVSDPSNTVVVQAATGTLMHVVVGVESGGIQTLGELIGGTMIGGMMAQSSAQTSVPSQFDATPIADLGARTRSGPPAIVLVAAGAPASWWLLRPMAVGIEGDAIYRIAATGAAPGGVLGARLMADNDGRHVVGYQEAPAERGRRQIDVFNVQTLEWTSVALQQSDIRSEVGTAVYGGYVFRTGGRDASGALRGDVTRIDYRTGEMSALPVVSAEPLPARSLPLLTWDKVNEGLVFAGGTDASGVGHSDVWSLRRGMRSAERIAADGNAATPIGPGSLVLASGAAGIAHVWVPPATNGQLLSHRIANDGVWTELDLTSGGPLRRMCPDNTPTTLCFAAGAAWWATPGQVCDGETCATPTSSEVATSLQLPLHGVRDMDLAAGKAWLARDSSVEVWDVSTPGAPNQITALALGAPVRAIASDGVGAGVATFLGFERISKLGSSYVISARYPLCGRATDVVSLDGGRWLVTTTIGAVLFDNDGPSGLKLRAMGIIHDGQSPTFVAVGDTPAGRGKCALWDIAHAVLTGPDPQRPGKATVWDGGRVVVVRDRSLLRLRINDSAIEVADSVHLPGQSQALRVLGDLAYVAGRHQNGENDVAVRLGPSLDLLGPHNVRPWVLRTDERAVRLRQVGSYGAGSAEVAWIQH